MKFDICSYGTGETEYDTVLECLEKEQCDGWYGGYLTKEQLLKLAEELKELANR